MTWNIIWVCIFHIEATTCMYIYKSRCRYAYSTSKQLHMCIITHHYVCLYAYSTSKELHVCVCGCILIYMHVYVFHLFLYVRVLLSLFLLSIFLCDHVYICWICDNMHGVVVLSKDFVFSFLIYVCMLLLSCSKVMYI